MQKNSILITIIIALVVGAVAFYGGMQFQQRHRPNFAGDQFRGPNGQQFQTRGNSQGARPINGEIISQDDKSITVKMQDGSSKIVLLSDTTAITEATSAAKESLTVGKQVMVIGTNNSDGSVTAQNIQLNPQSRGMFNQHPEGR